MDIAAAPVLADIVVDGKPIKAVLESSKQAFMYVFDRVTGKPVWPIEERPVEKGDVPGEWYSPTQPFPTKPPAFDYQGVTVENMIDFLRPSCAPIRLKRPRNTNWGRLFLRPW